MIKLSFIYKIEHCRGEGLSNLWIQWLSEFVTQCDWGKMGGGGGQTFPLSILYDVIYDCSLICPNGSVAVG